MKPEPAIFEDADQAAEAAADDAAIADVEAGRFLTHDAMKRWLQSWGAPDELPPPEVGD